jgi:HSP20 family protein
MNRLFDDTFRGAFGLADVGGAGGVTSITPRINVSETDQEIRIEAELPGVPEENVQVEVMGDTLTIRGEQEQEREEDRGENYHVVERVYGTFLRTIQLPFAVKPDQIQASFQNGVLTIVVPKSAAESQAHRVQLGRSGDSDRSQSTGSGQTRSAGSSQSQSSGSSGIDRAAAGDKPSSAAGMAGGGTAQAESGEGGRAESAESGKKSKA